jgi:hypothetical protein
VRAATKTALPATFVAAPYPLMAKPQVTGRVGLRATLRATAAALGGAEAREWLRTVAR